MILTHGKHAKEHKLRYILASALGMIALLLSMAPWNASAATVSPGNAALNWAEANAAGHWYQWAGTGPGGYDCSGLVMEAVGHATGIWLPRSTYAMLSNWHLQWIPLSQARRGDLLFYGSGHVEFDTVWYHASFGAHDSGSRIGWIRWGWGWQPTMAFRIR